MKHLETLQFSGKVNQQDIKIVQASCSYPITVKIPIADYEHAMRDVLIKIGVLYGIEKMPDTPRMAIFVKFMYDNFQRLTIPEIILAAESNLKKTSECRVEAFGSLTVDFLTKLIAEYQFDKQKAITAYNAAKTAISEPMHVKESPETVYNGLKSVFEQTGHPPIGWDYSTAFEWAWVNKLFKEPICEMKDWFDAEKQKIVSEVGKQIAVTCDMIERRRLELNRTDDAIKYECRKRWMIKHFENVIK